MMSNLREKRLVEDLQADLRLLSNETKRKYPPVKEAAESAIMIIRTALPSLKTDVASIDIVESLRNSCRDILQPFIMGCDTRSLSVVQLCLNAIQRIVTHEIADPIAAKNIVCVLWQIFEQGSEDLQLRLLQTVIVLVTSKSSQLSGQALAKAIVLCFRLHFTKNYVVNNTAEATIRQVVSLVFDRLSEQDAASKVSTDGKTGNFVPKTGVSKFEPPSGLTSQGEDAYYLFQDLCQLVISDTPHWLVGITEMTVSFGLELIENVLVEYGSVFKNHPELKFLLKDRVCALIIRLFSPNIQNRPGAPPPPSGVSPNKDSKPIFPLSMRLLRLVCLLLKQYYSDLITESEIFLSLLVKFLESNKPAWQCVLAIEVLSQLCAQPGLMKSFCLAYDMQTHSTKIFRNLVSALCTFIQNLFLNPSSYNTQGSSGDGSSSSPAGGVQAQFVFHQHGVNFPLPTMFSPTSSCIRYIYYDMLDKTEPPVAPEGYMLAMAYVSLLDLIKVLTENYSPETPQKDDDNNEKEPGLNLSKEDEAVLREMIGSSWENLYSVLSLLLNACSDETCISNILKSIGCIAGVCGHLKLNSPRDAFIVILCKAALPVNYVLPILQNSVPTLAKQTEAAEPNTFGEQQQVVVVGQSLPSNCNNLPPALCSVSLTAKNVQCMQSILKFAHIQGANINTAWQYVLSTLQHLVWILGLQPTSGGLLKPGSRSSDSTGATNSSVLTTAVLSDLPVLSNMLSKLFEASKFLDDVALHHLINALCSLSVEAMDTAYNAAVKEPSLFAVAKLLETGLVNMNRIEILWRPVTGHLLEVCQHTNNSLREWGAEGVVSLVKAAMKHYSGDKIKANPRLLHMFLLPFRELSAIDQQDVRIKQLEGVLQILHACGDNLADGWSTVLLIIGSATNIASESLVRLGFKSVQLVISDYLLALPAAALPCCIDVVEQYAKQTQDFNISLTAIGLLWSMSDYIHQNETRIQMEASKEQDASLLGPDKLWMYLFSKMGSLCMDNRPAVRKSAGQTLFSTLSAHWSTLSPDTLSQVIWQVLFPLMDSVQKSCNNASTERNKSSESNIMVHHSRDTEEKQWQETSVLTLAGISRVFKSKHSVLLKIKDFEAAWNKILDYIQTAATSNSVELSRSSLCSFEEILNPVETPDNSATKLPHEFWRKYWKAWCNIGIKITIPPPPGQTTPDEMLSQAYLTSLVLLFPYLHSRIADKFDAIDFKHLAQVLYGTVCIPVRSDTTAFILPTSTSVLTPLQQAVVNAVDVVQKSVSSNSDSSMYPVVFEFLLSIVDFASVPPTYGDVKNHTGPPDKTKWVCVNYVAFAEYCMQVVVSLFQITSCHKAVINRGILTQIIKTFRGPLTKKFVNDTTKTWQLAVNSLLKVMHAGLPVVRQHSQQHLFDNLWDELAGCMEDYLFPGSPLPPTLSVDEHSKLETYDVHLIELIRSEILPYRSCFPKHFLDKVVVVLNKGSLRTNSKDMDVQMNGERPRERLNKECFEALFQFSVLPLSSGGDDSSEESKMPSDFDINVDNIVSLLQRCRTSLTDYVASNRMKTHFPMSEGNLNDVLFSLKSVQTLLKRLLSSKIEVSQILWSNIFDLYPTLVECIPTSSLDVRTAVAQLIGLYQPFLSFEHVKR